jgi:Tfp pilus assembly protein PilF
MSMRLNLVDAIFNRGEKLHKLGRTADAQQILLRLAEFRSLPSEVAEMSQALLAEDYLKQNRFRKARRCLTSALEHRPDCARYHYLMAQAWENDDRGDDQKASEHYERSLQLDPEQPDCLSRAGMLLVEMGQAEEGLRRLRQAVELAPTDPALVERMVAALLLDDQAEEARAALLAARFRNARDNRFLKLWTDFQFQELRRRQRAEKLAMLPDDEEESPSLLPFVRIERVAATAARPPIAKIIRKDPPTPAAPPHMPQQPVRSQRRR